MGLGQVEDLLDRLAEAAAEEPARAQRDLALHGLEARAAGVAPGIEEGRQPRAPVGLATSRRAVTRKAAAPAPMSR